MGDFILHHLSGAIFGIGVVACLVAQRWAKGSAKSLEEATAFYNKAVEEAKIAAADRVATAVNKADKRMASEARRLIAEREADASSNTSGGSDG
ncbi:MAG TPA: hypothetical protein VFN70_18040 [Burkholderiales bacterium]|nr:hypothetical protein [Burkholderiales bacterium]